MFEGYLKLIVAALGSFAVNLAILGVLSSNSLTKWQLGESQLQSQQLKQILQSITLSQEPQAKVQKNLSQPPQELKLANTSIDKQKLDEKIIATTKTKKETKLHHSDYKKMKEHALKQHEESVKTQQAVVEITRQPKLAYTPPKLNYPITAINNNEQGKVKIEANITITGAVGELKIIQSSGFQALDQAAIKWFKKLKFTPALSQGKVVSTKVVQVVSFNLQEQIGG